jgi:hypothetical protein
MGRYAFFNTGLEYKFVFAKQCSSDMQRFQGIPNFDHSNLDDAKHSWTKEDQILIKEILDNLGDISINLNEFGNNVNGTYKLKNHLFDISNDYTLNLGWLIYHQLQYTNELEVSYEL